MAEPARQAPLQVAHLGESGLCLIGECPPAFDLDERMSAPLLKQLRSSPQAWQQALAVLCTERGCLPKAPDADPHVRWRLVRLSLAELKDALTSPIPAVRAMALLRLNLDSPGARAAAEDLLKDGAWLSPLPLTVADHAFARLHPDIDLPILGESANSKHGSPVPAWGMALNAYKGLPNLAALRNPATIATPDWQPAIARYDPKANAIRNRSMLASLWRLASREDLIKALGHAELDVRLAAFDALLIRYPQFNPVQAARQLMSRGDTVSTGGCIPMPQTLALSLLTALERSSHRTAAEEFLAGMPAADEKDVSPFGSRLEIALHLADHPAQARRHAAVLRRWVDEGLSEWQGLKATTKTRPDGVGQWRSRFVTTTSSRALSIANAPEDLPRLQRLADMGQFIALGQRADTPLLSSADRFRREHCMPNSDSCKGFDKMAADDWYFYVSGLPVDQALPLLAPLLDSAESPQAVRRVFPLSIYANRFGHDLDPALGLALWQRYGLLLPHDAEAALKDASGQQALARLRDAGWLSAQASKSNEARGRCWDYEWMVSRLLTRVRKEDQHDLLLQAFKQGPACSLSAYASQFLTDSSDYVYVPERLPSGRLPAHAKAVLRARLKRADAKELPELKAFWDALYVRNKGSDRTQ